MKRGIHPNHPNHLGCLNSDHCINHNVDDEQYSRSHVSEDCNCDPIMINEDQMMEIIEQDGIPLIDCRTMLTDSSSIALVKHAPKMTYAAISHVSFQSLYCCIIINITTIAVDRIYMEYSRCSSRKNHHWTRIIY
jgi:hypothetical protein